MIISMNTDLCISTDRPRTLAAPHATAGVMHMHSRRTLSAGRDNTVRAPSPMMNASLSPHRGRFQSGFRTCLYSPGTRGQAFKDQGQPNKFKESRGGGNHGHTVGNFAIQRLLHSVIVYHQLKFVCNGNLENHITVSFVFLILSL
jgi:hypothetical protein